MRLRNNDPGRRLGTNSLPGLAFGLARGLLRVTPLPPVPRGHIAWRFGLPSDVSRLAVGLIGCGFEESLMADAKDNNKNDESTADTSGHSLADHTLGANFTHEHEGEADHDHDHFEFDADGPIEQNPIWLQDHVTLVSVGIDIGSSGTPVIFSRIKLRR